MDIRTYGRALVVDSVVRKRWILNCLIMIQNLFRPILVAAAVASALFTRRFRFIGVLARVGFRVLAIHVHTMTTQVARESPGSALARAAREVDRVRNPAPTFNKTSTIVFASTGIGRLATSLGTI